MSKKVNDTIVSLASISRTKLCFLPKHMPLFYKRSIRTPIWNWRGRYSNLQPLFQILEASCPMENYEKRKSFYSFLGMPKNNKLHWFDSYSQIMVEFMYAQMINKILGIVSTFNYVALTCDEVSNVDIGSWISIHAYVMQK